MHNSNDDRKKTLCFCAFIIVLASGLFMACTPNYHIDNYQAYPKRPAPYSSYSFIVSDEENKKLDILQSIKTGLSNNLMAIGLKDDSHNPELIFIMRWEEHLIGRVSSSNSKEPTKRLSESDSSGRHILSNASYFKKEAFIRIQAIDATRNELIWSVKIYSHQKKGLASESIPKVVRDLTLSFQRVQFNIDKID